MGENAENKFSFTMDLKDEDGNIRAVISVIPSKEAGKRDILLMDVQEGNFSVRSITELLNLLERKEVPVEDRKNVLEFLAERLLFLEQNEL